VVVPDDRVTKTSIVVSADCSSSKQVIPCPVLLSSADSIVSVADFVTTLERLD
jgi:hypothetical protein